MTRIFSLLLALTLLTLVAGCAQPNKVQDERKATTDLQTSVSDFHLKMRWGLWEQAAIYTDDVYRARFEARFEELGEDYKITDLTVKSVKLEGTEATVDVEQSWYHEPDMTLNKERFIEDWTMKHGIWRISSRMERDEWRKLNEADKAEAAADLEGAEDAGAAEDDPEAEPSDADQTTEPTDAEQTTVPTDTDQTTDAPSSGEAARP